jgi:DNA-binding PadR family transcriptional regulator
MLPRRPELLKGHLDALLLSMLESGPQHGYTVIEALRSGSDGTLDLPTGTVYPALHRLERPGRAALSQQRAVWDQCSTAVTALLRGRPAY